MNIKLYDKIRLKTGEIGRVVEILYNADMGRGYLVDVEEQDGEYRTDTVLDSEIKSVFFEVEKPVVSF
jgi:hypothetical protein